jgi:transposase
VIPHGVEVFVALDLIDLRWGLHRLSGVVAERLGHEARSGALFVFFGKRRDTIKVLFFDGTGICLFYKRLDMGTFRVPVAPEEGAAVVAIEERALDDLLHGIDLEAPSRSRRRDAGAADTAEPTIVTAPLPPQILPRALATPSLLAHILSDKFCDGLPFHRQECMA